MTQLILSNSTIGTHACNVTKQAEEAIPTKYLLGKFGTQKTDVALCGSSDLPIGIITDEAADPTSGWPKEIVNVALLGSPNTLQAVASTEITAGSIVVPAENGKVKPLPAPTGNDQICTMIGIALTPATADGQVIEFMSCVPQQHVVKGS
ncbi:MAG: hypothetical protein LBI47_03485 [Puniceicoccales bacterium]|jgi:hypothetical protein|nr:hypothetical protein [Puniceicoccales bacterium]